MRPIIIVLLFLPASRFLFARETSHEIVAQCFIEAGISISDSNHVVSPTEAEIINSCVNRYIENNFGSDSIEYDKNNSSLYKWKDGKGHWHYSDSRPPSGTELRRMIIEQAREETRLFRETPLEENGVIEPGINREDIDAFGWLIRDNGYKCDSISGVLRNKKKSDEYIFLCNQERYVYTVTDFGGNWTVIPID